MVHIILIHNGTHQNGEHITTVHITMVHITMEQLQYTWQFTHILLDVGSD